MWGSVSDTILQQQVSNFFAQQQELLEKNYPGITLQRLLRDLSDSFFIKDNHSLEQWKWQLRQGVPLEYIYKRAYFYKSEFFVDQRVLIPRSETEILVEHAVNFLQPFDRSLTILDMGCGSGAIGLSIAQESKGAHRFLLSDISSDALTVAQHNLWGLQYRINPQHDFTFIKSDRLSKVMHNLDLIVTNPPYIKLRGDRQGVHQQVACYEPAVALFLDDTNYDEWFITLFKQSYEQLKSEGLFLMEGHEEHLAMLAHHLEDCGFKQVTIIKDYTSRPRFLQGVKK